MKRSKHSHKSTERSSTRQHVFGLMLLLVPFVLFAGFELSLRLMNYGERYSLFNEVDYENKKYKITNPEYGRKYFSNIHYTSPINDIFLKKKPQNGLRIFVMGSSTVAGFPYNSGFTFSRILHQRLQDSYPDRYVEVINLAITAINSYTLNDQTNQVLKQEPDAILIYAGHNEFYGALGVSSNENLGKYRLPKLLHLNMLQFRTYQFTRNVLRSVSIFFTDLARSEEVTGRTIMENIASAKPIAFQSELYLNAHHHYQQNIASILKKAAKKDVPVFIAELVSNVKDLEPLESITTIDKNEALITYEKACTAEKNGDYTEARKLYYQAKDLDGIRFRASEEINNILNKLASKHGATLVPMKSYFETSSPHGLIGNTLMTEHVHPNIDGYFLMADAYYTSIVTHQQFNQNSTVILNNTEDYRYNWGFTPFDSVFAHLRVMQLMSRWPFTENNSSASFLDSYKPNNKIDSLAYKVLTQELSIMDACLELSSHHESISAFQVAADYMLTIARSNPHNPAYFSRAGDLLLKSNQPEKALRTYLQTLKHVRKPEHLYKIGELCLSLGQLQTAQSYLNEALPLAANDLRKHINSLLLSINEQEKFQAITKEADDTNPKVVIFAPEKVQQMLDSARLLRREQQYEKALTLLLEANAIHETPAANRYIGEILLQYRQKDALIFLKKALPYHNNNPLFVSTLCYACIQFNEIELAEEMLKKIKQLEPNHPMIGELERELSNSIKNRGH